MAESVEDIDLLIDDYLDGRMDQAVRTRFEERIKKDSALRDKVMSATHSVDLVQQALGWVTPGDEFDEGVSKKIITITQSGQNLQPPVNASERSLTSGDPDAKLLADPEAAREKWRLIFLSLVAALVFLIAVAVIIMAINKQKPDDKQKPEVEIQNPEERK